jgi:hypothetical protein
MVLIHHSIVLYLSAEVQAVLEEVLGLELELPAGLGEAAAVKHYRV